MTYNVFGGTLKLTLLYCIIVTDGDTKLSITGSKVEHQAVNAGDGPVHPMVHSRPTSKWCKHCMLYF